METRKFTQFGTFSVGMMLPIFIFCLIMLLISGTKDPVQVIILGFVTLTLLICLLIFYKITIYIDSSYVRFILGAGLVRKKYLISDIESCKAVRNSPLYGIGIRKIPRGWLYNVSGLGAVELSFRNKKSLVRIGTNDPEKVADTINRLVGNTIYEDNEDYKDSSGYIFSAVIISLALIFPVLMIISGNRDTEVIITPNDFIIKGIYGSSVGYSEIVMIDTISVLPEIKRRTNGYSFGNTLRGNFTLTGNTKVKLFIKNGTPPYIRIETKDHTIYMNFKNPEKTVNIHKQLVDAINKTSVTSEAFCP